MRRLLSIVTIGLGLSGTSLLLHGQDTQAQAFPDYLNIVSVPANLKPPPDAKPVVIAIVDDGFRLSHEALRPFIWTNPREIPDNRVDDDGNGCVDDLQGWDVADGDEDVTPPPGRELEFYHGTHLAGTIAQIARQAYGDQAARWIRILPVKCLEDDAEKAYLKSGYKGIRYAIDAGADIILTAWSEPNVDSRELRILEDAEKRGILLVSAAGNSYSDIPQYPAAFPAALSIAAVDNQWVRLEQSGYGSYVDLVAPGRAIPGAASDSDRGFVEKDGTSMAAAITAGSAAILKVQRPHASIEEIATALKNTASRVEPNQPGEIFFGGKLGAGMVKLDRALQYDPDQQPLQANNELKSHQGYLVYARPLGCPVLWRIRPYGEVHGFWFEQTLLEGEPGASRLQVFLPESDPGQPFHDIPLKDLQERIFVPGTQAMVLLIPDPEHPDFTLRVEYASKPINQSTLYCEGIQNLSAEGIIEDGSGEAPYSPQSDCKWLITAPEGKVIHIEFLEFDTEANTDWLYFFNGAGTHEKIMAVYSGPAIPPALTTWSNQVLLWFVTDASNQGNGWKAVVTFVDPEVSP